MANVLTLSITDRVAEVIRRSKKNLGPEVGRQLDSLIAPANLAIIAGTLAFWAGSHLFGVGEIVDVLLLLVGTLTIGWSMGAVANDIYIFASKTVNARTDNDLDVAAAAFSRAVVLGGVTVIMALLLRRSIKQIQATRGSGFIDAVRPRIKPGLPNVGPDPAAGKLWSRPGITNDPSMPPGDGSTSPFGEVQISSDGSLTQQALARTHESVHQFLTPRFGILRTFRVRVGIAGYVRVSLLRYIEEALAETVAQVKVVGGRSAMLKGLKFPVLNGYVTVTNLHSEGMAIGTIIAGTQLLAIHFVAAAPKLYSNVGMPVQKLAGR